MLHFVLDLFLMPTLLHCCRTFGLFLIRVYIVRLSKPRYAFVCPRSMCPVQYGTGSLIKKNYKDSPAKEKGNARQRCMCEGPVRTKSKLTTMFHLDSTADDALCHIQCMNFSIEFYPQGQEHSVCLFLDEKVNWSHESLRRDWLQSCKLSLITVRPKLLSAPETLVTGRKIAYVCAHSVDICACQPTVHK